MYSAAMAIGGISGRWYAAAWWVAVVVWMVVMFALSSQPDADQSGGRELPLGAYKLAQFVEYGVLGLLLSGAFRQTHVPRAAWWAWVVVVIYAIGDEIHQAYVPGRSPLVSDIAIDAAGGLLGVLAYIPLEIVREWRARRLHERQSRQARKETE